MPKKLTYERALSELQTIVRDLEESRVSIDDLDQQVERARELYDFCKTRLRTTQTTVDRLLEEEE